MFGPKVLEVVDSPINGKLEVRKLGQDVYVTSGGLTQSGGLIKELWEKAFKVLGSRFQVLDKKWLILGLATGTVAKIISRKYAPLRMVGVEVDPEMVRLGKKYFGLDQIPDLEIIQQDALDYVLGTTSVFDTVVVDLYVGDQLPAFVYQKSFLEQLGQLGKLVILNHLFYDADKRAQAKLLADRAATVFPSVQLIRELTNLLLICSHGRRQTAHIQTIQWPASYPYPHQKIQLGDGASVR